MYAANQFFQPALSARVATPNALGLLSNRAGELVTDVADVAQCILVILTTPQGADPLRPLFGSQLHNYLDWPIDAARPHLVREIVTALNAWEPRIGVTQVSVTLSGVAGLEAIVNWRFTAEAEQFVAVIPLGVST